MLRLPYHPASDVFIAAISVNHYIIQQVPAFITVTLPPGIVFQTASYRTWLKLMQKCYDAFIPPCCFTAIGKVMWNTISYQETTLQVSQSLVFFFPPRMLSECILPHCCFTHSIHIRQSSSLKPKQLSFLSVLIHLISFSSSGEQVWEVWLWGDGDPGGSYSPWHCRSA